jgi:hypothetical protein
MRPWLREKPAGASATNEPGDAMNATLVGADRLGNIPALLEAQGIRVLCHISGRAASAQRRTSALPKDTQLLILFTDFLGHNVMRTFRQAAQEEGVAVLACRRSASCLMQSLERRGGRALSACAQCPAQSKPATSIKVQGNENIC